MARETRVRTLQPSRSGSNSLTSDHWAMRGYSIHNPSANHKKERLPNGKGKQRVHQTCNTIEWMEQTSEAGLDWIVY